jgi:hypothetical protein
MKKILRIAALGLALALAVPSLPAAAQTAAPTKEQQDAAATRFRKGLDLYKDGDFQAALIEFRRAYELAPNFNVLYNIGQVSFQLQDYPGALNAFERYLTEGGDRVSAARKADVAKDIEKLKARVANLEIVCSVPDAEITLDDVVVGKSPLPRPILVSAGRHKVSVSKAGFTVSTKVIDIASGDALKVPIDPVEQSVAPPVGPVEPRVPDRTTPPPVNPPPVVPPSRPVRVTPIVFGVTTGVLTVGSVVTGILALGASSNLATLRTSPTATSAALQSGHDKTAALALTTDILWGAAVVSLGVTLYTALRKEAPAAPPATGTTGLSQVRVKLGADGVRVLGSF